MDYTDVCSGQALYILYSMLYSYCGQQERRQKVVLYLRNKVRICESLIWFWTLSWSGGMLTVIDTCELSKWDHQGSLWPSVAPVQVLPWLTEPFFFHGEKEIPLLNTFRLVCRISLSWTLPCAALYLHGQCQWYHFSWELWSSLYNCWL